jgi:hypothetical protein
MHPVDAGGRVVSIRGAPAAMVAVHPRAIITAAAPRKILVLLDITRITCSKLTHVFSNVKTLSLKK